MNRIKALDAPVEQKIQMLRQIKFSKEDFNCSCRGRRVAAENLLAKMIHHEIKKLEGEC